jgi:oligopeptidase B
MDITPPKAEKIEKKLEIHDDVRIDPYYWLNERDNEKVIDYLKRENDYFDMMTAHTKDLQEKLFQEMKGRIKEDDESVPYFYNGYYYQTRFEKGKDYPVYTRKKGSLDAMEEVLFNVNEMAEEHTYYNLKGISISPNNKWVSYGVDTISRRNYIIYIKNLETGKVLMEQLPMTTGGAIWANDNKTLFYVRRDEQTLRSNRIFKHELGTDPDNDVLVFEESDETYSCFIYKSKSKEFLVIGSYSTLSNEYRILEADNPNGEFRVFQPRIRGLEYSISHYKNNFYILTNKDKAINFKLMKTPATKTGQENWLDVIPHRDDVLLEDIDIFKEYLVIGERSNGLNRLRIIRWDKTSDYYLPFDSETYTAYTQRNLEYDTKILRYSYNSLTTPPSVIDFDMETREKEILKETEVLGGEFDKKNYQSERLWATAQDGTSIPVSLVYRKGTGKVKKAPLLLYAYGSYGTTIDPYFSSVRLSLLDRGFVYAIAHVRGGEYLGRAWYDDGKLMNKKNSFTDFIDVSKFLIKKGYTEPEHLYAYGGSAGGLLIGVVINLEPGLYNGVIAAVPFVDVVTTMLDDSIPLTTGEYDEWGNPNNPEFYHYLRSYSPYDNVIRKEYPNILVTTGLHDSQVQYWEPAKWVAKLRDYKTDRNLLLLHTNMDTGHSGASGRFESLNETAMKYAFLLDLEGIKE